MPEKGPYFTTEVDEENGLTLLTLEGHTPDDYAWSEDFGPFIVHYGEDDEAIGVTVRALAARGSTDAGLEQL